MADAGESNETRVTVVKRVGFWLGLVLFVAILATPTPSSMREVVRNAFGDAIRTDVAKALKPTAEALKRVEQEAELESQAHRRAVAEAIERRARVMVAAAAVTALVACWWITVAIPIPVTSLLPLVLFP
ncbi:unnamed protein product, partial [marine sediment metagenome]